MRCPSWFDVTQPGNIIRALVGERIGTLVSSREATAEPTGWEEERGADQRVREGK
jgi:hypothetical protein